MLQLAAAFSVWPTALADYVLSPLITLISCLLSIFVVLGNLLVVTAIWHEPQLHTVTNYLIASLAAADCLVGALVMPFNIISEIILGSWTFGATWCDLWHSFDVLASTASIMNLCAISLDRYLAITNPISYPTKMTPKRVAFLIVSIWTCSSLISFPAIVWWRAVSPTGPLQEIATRPPTRHRNDSAAAATALQALQYQQQQPQQHDENLIVPQHISSSSSSGNSLAPAASNGDQHDRMPLDELLSAELLGPTPIAIKEYKCVFTDDTYYLLFSSFISFYGPLCVMLYAYYCIYRAAVQQTRFLKYGSKQVMVAGSGGGKKRPRYLSELSTGGAGGGGGAGGVNSSHGGDKLNSSDKDYDHSSQSNGGLGDRQRLVLRVHRGGAANLSNSTYKSSSEHNSSQLAACGHAGATNSPSHRRHLASESSSLVGQNCDTFNNNNNNKSFANNNQQAAAVAGWRQANGSTGSHAGGSLTSQLGSRFRRQQPSRRDELRVRSQRFDSSSTPTMGSAPSVDQQRMAPPPLQVAGSATPPPGPLTNQASAEAGGAIARHRPPHHHLGGSVPMRAMSSQRAISLAAAAASAATSNNSMSANSSRASSSSNSSSNSSANSTTNNSHSTSGSNSRDSIVTVEARGLVVGEQAKELPAGAVGDQTFRAHKRNSSAAAATNSRHSSGCVIVSLNDSHSRSATSNAKISSSDSTTNEQLLLPGASESAAAKSKCDSQLLRKFRRTISLESALELAARRHQARKKQALRQATMNLMDQDAQQQQQRRKLLVEDCSPAADFRHNGLARTGHRMSPAYSDSDRFIRSIVDLSAIHYIDCTNQSYGLIKKAPNVPTGSPAAATLGATSPPSGRSSQAGATSESNQTAGGQLPRLQHAAAAAPTQARKTMSQLEPGVRVPIVQMSSVGSGGGGAHSSPSASVTTSVANHPSSEHHAGQLHQPNHNHYGHHHNHNHNHHHHHHNNQHNQQQQQQQNGKKLTKLAKERKAAKTLGIVVGVFILCWLPFFVVNIIVATCGIQCIFKPHILISIVTWLGWLNSAMNPVIYACWSRDFRRAFRKTLCTWVEFVCYDGSNMARKLRLKKGSNYLNTQEANGRGCNLPSSDV